MMIKINYHQVILVSAISFLLLVNIATAHEMEGKSVEQVIEDIIVSQTVSAADQIDCAQVSFLDFADLGDAVMERMIGDHELHEQMDSMMGGEGSQSLLNMHTAIGRNWLGCENSFQGMMGGMMTPTMMRMIVHYYPAYYSNYDYLLILTVVGWVLFVILAILNFSATGKFVITKRR